MNIILITLDDVSDYSLGFTRFFLDVTPNINNFASESYTFWNAHCNIPFCEPSRSVLMTGLYPQNNGSTEFNPIKKGITTASSCLRDIGYKTILIGKQSHYKNHHFDEIYRKLNDYHWGDFEPQFLNINLTTTHRPFENKPIEVNVLPNFLPNNQTMRDEVGCFLSSLQKTDEEVGFILSKVKSDDLVILTSDHGMSFPYIKGCCYGTSTNVPMIIRHESIQKKNDRTNIISHVDFAPTIAEWLGFKLECDGTSYLNTLLYGKKVVNDFVYTQLNRMMHGPLCRSRSLTTRTHSYTINIDQSYPGHCVDGWGWEKSLNEMDNSFYRRDIEELNEYHGLNIYKVDDNKMKLKMRLKLLELMKKYNDPECIIAKNKLMELNKFL